VLGQATSQLDLFENRQADFVNLLEKANTTTDRAITVTEKSAETTKRVIELLERTRRTK
jgi:hypothetical protein